jgi:D-alanyl-D-alanine carboxypeptidase
MRRFTILIALTILFIPSVAMAAPLRNTSFKAFDQAKIKTKAAVVMDAETGQLLYTYHPDWQWPLASITKLMTSLVYTEQNPNWDATVAMAQEDEVGGGRLRVTTGSELSKRDLLYCAIVGSANNTATAMMRTSGLTTDQFIGRMNELARTMNLKQTVFRDPSGMDPTNMSSAMDVATLARSAFINPAIQRAAQTGQYTFVIRSSGEVKKIINTDKLLTNDNSVYVVGGKTGYLDESQNNFVVQLRPPTQGKNKKGDVIVSVLGSPTKEASFSAAKVLAQWAWKSHEWPQSRQLTKR